MRYINVPCRSGSQIETIYKIEELPLLYYLIGCKESKKRGVHYLEIPASFDIETTTISSWPEEVYRKDPAVYKRLKSLKIKYSDKIRRDIAGFGDLRRSHIKMLSRTTGVPVDSIYPELTEWRPDLFPPDIWNPSDQLLKIIDVYDENKSYEIKFRPFAYMYHWQFCLADRVVFGRTWEEFVRLLAAIERGLNLDHNHRLVIWCHNLSFEATFMNEFIHIIDGFWKEERSPLKILTDQGIEFRDSLALSNMSLAKWCENENVEHAKLSGDDYQYEILRYPTSVLSEEEEAYCYNDVRGLCECIANYLTRDTLASIPMTSTGFIRRECRAKMYAHKKDPKTGKKARNINRLIFEESALDAKLYTMMREAFRGGDTHGNVLYAGVTLHNVYSYDIASSYPAALITEKYPIGKFVKISAKRFKSGTTRADNAHILRLIMKNPRYVGTCGMPYLPYSTSTARSPEKDPETGKPRKASIDNGRILYYPGIIQYTVTDIDYDLILEEYTADEIYIADVYMTHKDYLPVEFRDYVIERYHKKTALKNVSGKEYEYNKEKGKINALFGMCVTAIDNPLVTYDQKGDTWIVEKKPLQEMLDKYYRSYNSFLPYQWGVWCTAHARKKLRKMLRTCGRDAVYCDTDSVKFINQKHVAEFEEFNRELEEIARRSGGVAQDKNGKEHPIGVWEFEGCYPEFRHLASKRYILKKGDKYITTIAGVRKDRGAEHFNKVGIDRFRAGEVIPNSGHLVAYYNKAPKNLKIRIDGIEFTSGSNVALVNDTYTLGITDEYADLMQKAKKDICTFEYV